MTLIEVVVGLAILTSAGFAVMSGLSTSMQATITNDIHAKADALAKGQMEFIKGMPYAENCWAYSLSSSGASASPEPCWWNNDNPPQLDSEYSAFTVYVTANEFNADDIPGNDAGIRQIEIQIHHPRLTATPVVILESYEVAR